MTSSGRVLVAVAVIGLGLALARPAMTAHYERAPEFTSQDPKEWIGPPQSMKALAGKVVMLDVWTFG